jgi:hypothetical protein
LRMLTADYTGNITGSPTVGTDGSYTTLTWTTPNMAGTYSS